MNASDEEPSRTAGPWYARAMRPERVYLVLAVGFGLAYVLITPPLQVADERAHFRRAFSLSEGHIIALKQGNYTGDEQPVALDHVEERYDRFFMHHEQKATAAELFDGTTIHFEGAERNFAAFSNAAIHPPLTYIPQAVAIFLARHLSSSVLICFYAGRVANLLAATSLTFLAIRWTPAGKWAFAALALTPMSVSLMASHSSDALTNAIAFLFIAEVFALALGSEKRIAGRSLALLALLAAALGLAKQAYFFLPLSYLMIPPRKAGSAMRYWVSLAVIMSAVLLAAGSWASVVRRIYSPADPRFGMNPAEQIHLMRQRPLEFLLVLARTVPFAWLYCEEFVGWLGFADLRLATWVYVLSIVLLVVVFAIEFGPRSGVRARQALVAAGITAIVALTVMVVMHITWDAVGSKNVSLQGRYFIPIGPLAGLVIGRLAGGTAPAALARLAAALPVAVPAVAIGILSAGLARIHERYFVDTPESAAQRCYVQGTALEKNGHEQQAREQFEEAIRIYPEHIAARFDLAHLLARQGEFPEAIRQFQETLSRNPSDANVKVHLALALKAQQALRETLRKIGPVFQEIIRSRKLAEERHRDGPRSGQYLKPIHGSVVDGAGKAPFRVEFIWCSPPPSGDEALLEETASPQDDSRNRRFFACSAKPFSGTRRIFVFAPPLEAVLLADDAVSWYYQRQMIELSQRENERELEYRRQHAIRFPLAELPH